jgi:hypothetical protein
MTCPVCSYKNMPFPPEDYNICPCCGTEFGNDDANTTHDELLARWLHNGAPWFFGAAPLGWNPYLQLRDRPYLRMILVANASNDVQAPIPKLSNRGNAFGTSGQFSYARFVGSETRNDANDLELSASQFANRL